MIRLDKLGGQTGLLICYKEWRLSFVSILRIHWDGKKKVGRLSFLVRWEGFIDRDIIPILLQIIFYILSCNKYSQVECEYVMFTFAFWYNVMLILICTQYLMQLNSHSTFTMLIITWLNVRTKIWCSPYPFLWCSFLCYFFRRMVQRAIYF